MTVGRLISELQEHWNLDDEIIVKMQGHVNDTEYDIVGITWYADYSNKEGGSSPAILIEE
jgi:hypothetical protein